MTCCNCGHCRMLNPDLDLTPAMDFKAECSCKKPAIVSMGQGSFTNSMCSSCGYHWYGHGEVKEYTRKEWDALMETALNEVKP